MKISVKYYLPYKSERWSTQVDPKSGEIMVTALSTQCSPSNYGFQPNLFSSIKKAENFINDNAEEDEIWMIQEVYKTNDLSKRKIHKIS